MKTDSNDKVKISNDNCSDIIVVGDWIHYTNSNDNYSIYKVRTDGTNKTKISNDGSSWITVN
jgi:hypothetical protein